MEWQRALELQRLELEQQHQALKWEQVCDQSTQSVSLLTLKSSKPPALKQPVPTSQWSSTSYDSSGRYT